jgi:MFS family permease
MAGIIFGLQVVDRSLAPLLPIHLGRIGVATERVAAVAGGMFSAWAGMAAIGHHVGSRLVVRRPAHVVVAGGACVSAVGVGALALVAHPAAVLGGLALLGLGVGAGMTAAFTAAGSVVPSGSHGSAFGLLTAASMGGLAISPMASGAAAGWSIEGVFAFDVVVLMGLAWMMWRRRADPHGVPATRPVKASDGQP